MKKLLALFFIVSFLCFGEDIPDNKNIVKSIQMKEEIELLKNQVIELSSQVMKSNNKIELERSNNKDQVYSDSLKYYKRSIDDAKEMYNKSAEDTKEIFSDSITLILAMIGLVGASLGVLLTIFQFKNKNQLEKEKEILEKLKEYTVKKIEKLEIEYKKNNNKLNEKIKQVEFNSQLGIAINKNTPEEKIKELKKIEKYLENLSKENLKILYFQLAYNNSNLKEGEKYCSKVIDLDPSYSIGYNNRGELRKRLGNNDGAMSDFNKAIDLNTNSATAYHNRATLKRILNDNNGAMSDFDEAINLDPNDSVTYNNRADTKNYLGNTKEAIKDLNKAIDLDPNYEIAYFNRGELRNKLGNTKEAIQDLDKAIDINPNYSKAYSNRGDFKKILGEKDEAMNDFNKAIDINPNYRTYNNRGMLRSELGDLKGAIKDFNRSIDLNSNNATIYNSRAIIYLAVEKFKLALDDLLKIKNIDKNYNLEILISKKNYSKFMGFLDNIKDKTDDIKEIQKKFKTKEKIQIS